MTPSLRPPGFVDLAAMTALHAAAFGAAAWTEAMLRDSLTSADVWGLLLTGPEPLGFALCQQVAEDCEILTFAIAPAQQRRGLGRTLLQGVYDAAKQRRTHRLLLEVAADNTPARRLYTVFGFDVSGVRPRYYPRPNGAADAILMHHLIVSVQ